MEAELAEVHDKIIKRYKNRMRRLARNRSRRELKSVYSTIAKELDSLIATSNDTPRRKRR